MSCGDPHETPCAEVLALVYIYMDDEIDHAHRLQVWAHLQECPPCGQEYELEKRLKARVSRACSCDVPPVHLRARIVSQIRSISVTYPARDIDTGGQQ